MGDRDLIWLNRALMSDVHVDAFKDLMYEKTNMREMKAFWLTVEGRLVYVDSLSEDLKFRSMRERNISRAMNTSESKMYSEMMKASSSAHRNLMSICEQAASLSRGRFYNLYARYPLPIAKYETQVLQSESILGSDDQMIHATEIQTGFALLNALEPLYVEYFKLLKGEPCDGTLYKVSLLGAQWLVDQDRAEITFAEYVRHDWFTRIRIALAFLFDL